MCSQLSDDRGVTVFDWPRNDFKIENSGDGITQHFDSKSQKALYITRSISWGTISNKRAFLSEFSKSRARNNRRRSQKHKTCDATQSTKKKSNGACHRNWSALKNFYLTDSHLRQHDTFEFSTDSNSTFTDKRVSLKTRYQTSLE